MTIGERIKLIRGTMSQAEFATMTKLNKATLSRYERDANVPDANAIVRICSACNIRSEWLLTGEGEPSKTNRMTTEKHDNAENETITVHNLEYNKCILDAISQAFGEIIKAQHTYIPRVKFQMIVYILYEEFVYTAMDYIQTIRGSFEKQIMRKNKVINTLIRKMKEYDEQMEKQFKQEMLDEIIFEEIDRNTFLQSLTYEQMDRIVKEEFKTDEEEIFNAYVNGQKEDHLLHKNTAEFEKNRPDKKTS